MRNKKNLQKMHVADLYTKIVAGDRDALNELIERQQSGRSLRFYPDGRNGPNDDGMIPIVVDVCDESVCIRSGQPLKPVVIDKQVALKWITGIPKCLSSVVSNYKLAGVSDQEIERRVSEKSTENFDHEIIYTYKEDSEEVSIQFLPAGKSQWKLDTQDCCNLIKSLCDVCMDMGWQYADAVSEKQANVVATMYSKGH